MKVALINPPWSFAGSIYFGCREPHLPLELAYARALLERNGHVVKLIDAPLAGASLQAVQNEVESFHPDVSVLTTAPSYLFWRCAQPELRIPMQTARALRPYTDRLIAVGPHASTTPRSVLRKLGADAVVLGECEEVLVRLVEADPGDYSELDSIAYFEEAGQTKEQGSIAVRGSPASVNMHELPALRWESLLVERHQHHHHRFDRTPHGPGAEMEVSRGCPYACTFCAKETFRNRYRKRPLDVVLEELDGLIACGARYVYFIDEIFLPDRELLLALVTRDIEFGVQLRIDNWSEEMLRLLGQAGCVSIEAGVESITEHGRSLLNKRCKLSTDELTQLLFAAKSSVPFVQANLIGTSDDPAAVSAWRAQLATRGVWSNEPVPMFAYPGSPEYRLRWGALQDDAWERAHAEYLKEALSLSDIQDQRPLPLPELEREPLLDVR
jgi:B12-binding domain/radical SAM domain protein of rhizo-twelve system